jgi:hypothetical protein
VDEVKAGHLVTAAAHLVPDQREDGLVERSFLRNKLDREGDRLPDDPIGDDVALAGTVDKAGKQVQALHGVPEFDPLPGGTCEGGEGVLEALALGGRREVANEGARFLEAPVRSAEQVVKADNWEVLLTELLKDELVAEDLGVNKSQQGIEVTTLVVNRSGGKAHGGA